MRFSIVFAGLLIGVSMDAEALWANLAFWFVYPVLFAMLYVDLLELTLDNRERVKEIKEEQEKKSKATKGE